MFYRSSNITNTHTCVHIYTYLNREDFDFEIRQLGFENWSVNSFITKNDFFLIVFTESQSVLESSTNWFPEYEDVNAIHSCGNVLCSVNRKYRATATWLEGLYTSPILNCTLLALIRATICYGILTLKFTLSYATYTRQP